MDGGLFKEISGLSRGDAVRLLDGREAVCNDKGGVICRGVMMSQSVEGLFLRVSTRGR